MAGGFETVAARPPQRPPAPPRQQTASLRGAFPSLRFQPLNSRSREAWSRHPLAGARCSTTGELDHRRAGARPVTRTSAVPPRRCAFQPLNSRSREAWSRHPLAGARCSTTGELDHRRAGARPVTRTSAVPSPSLRFSTPELPQPRGVVSTPARWRSLLDHRRARPPPSWRPASHPDLRGATPSLRFSTPAPAAARRGLDTRSLALAARPPESSTTAELAPGQSPGPPRCHPVSALSNP